MGSSKRLFGRERTVQQILGCGTVADIILWRQKDLTIGIVVVTLGTWLVFEKLGHTLVSLVSNVLLLLFLIIFLWAKSAAILNRPPPSLPDLYLSEQIVNDLAATIRDCTNALLSASKSIALGKDTRVSFKVAACLLLISIMGRLTDFLTLGCTCLLILLTVPAFYETYEDQIDRYMLTVFGRLHQLYLIFLVEFLGRFQNWILAKKKLI